MADEPNPFTRTDIDIQILQSGNMHRAITRYLSASLSAEHNFPQNPTVGIVDRQMNGEVSEFDFSQASPPYWMQLPLQPQYDPMTITVVNNYRTAPSDHC